MPLSRMTEVRRHCIPRSAGRLLKGTTSPWCPPCSVSATLRVIGQGHRRAAADPRGQTVFDVVDLGVRPVAGVGLAQSRRGRTVGGVRDRPLDHLRRGLKVKPSVRSFAVHGRFWVIDQFRVLPHSSSWSPCRCPAPAPSVGRGCRTCSPPEDRRRSSRHTRARVHPVGKEVCVPTSSLGKLGARPRKWFSWVRVLR